MKKDYIYIIGLLISSVVMYFSYIDNKSLMLENRRIQDRNKELKEITIAINNQLKESQEKKGLLLLTIDSLSKKDTVYIKTQSRNESTFKKDSAVIDSVSVNELIRLFTN